MAKYVEGFVIPIPKGKVQAYKKIATSAGKVWMKHGALSYFETVGQDLKEYHGMKSFPQIAKAKPSETVIFAWIMYKSKAHRDAVMKKVLKDPFMQGPPMEMPFDMKKMCYGGFKVLVEGKK